MTRYEHPSDATVADVRAALLLGDPAATASALVGVTLGGSDPAGVEQLCRELLDSPERTVAGVAATCLGHVARLQGALTEESVTALRARRSDPRIGGQVSDALDDVDTFTRG